MKTDNIEDMKIKLCDTATEALHSKPVLDFLDNFLSTTLSLEEAKKLHQIFENLLSLKSNTDEEMLFLEDIISKYREDIISKGDLYIENNLSVPEIVTHHDLNASNIFKILDFYIFKARVNGFKDKALNCLVSDDYDITTDKNKEKGNVIIENEEIFIYSIGKALFIKNKFDSARDLEFDGFVLHSTGFTVKNGTKKGFLDMNGKQILPCEHELLLLNGDNIIFGTGNVRGLFSIKKMKRILDCEYERFYFLDNYTCVRKGGKWGIYSNNDYDNYLINPILDQVPSFQENGLHICLKDGKYGLYSENFREIFPFNFHTIEVSENGLCLLENENGKSAYKISGNTVFQIEVNSNDLRYVKIIENIGYKLNFYNNNECIVLFNGERKFNGFKSIKYHEGLGFLVENELGKFGFFNLNFEEIIEPKYEKKQIDVLGCGVFLDRPFRFTKEFIADDLNKK